MRDIEGSIEGNIKRSIEGDSGRSGGGPRGVDEKNIDGSVRIHEIAHFAEASGPSKT